MSTTFNLLDLIFIAFTLIFVVTAFFRGFIKEIFSLFGWIVAFTLSYILAPYVSKFIEGNKVIVDISARSIIFIIVFFGCALSTAGLCRSLKEKIPSSFDRSLGVLFGLIKTVLIFGLVYSIILNAMGYLVGKSVGESSPQFPNWLKDAKCHDIMKFSGEAIDPAVKLLFDAVTENFDRVIPKQKNNDLDEKIDEVMDKKDDTKEPLDKASDEIKPSGKSSSQDSGYNKKDIEKMNRLIEVIGK